MGERIGVGTARERGDGSATSAAVSDKGAPVATVPDGGALLAAAHNEGAGAAAVPDGGASVPSAAQPANGCYVTGEPDPDAPVVGVLYESSEWSDFKLAQELAARGCPVRMVDMERPDAVAAALACDLLVSRVFASARARGHAASHTHMAEVVVEAAKRGIRMVNSGRAHAFEVSKRAATAELAHAGFAVPQVYACDRPDEFEPGAWTYPCLIKPDCGGRSARTAVLADAAAAASFLAEAPSETTFIVESYERARAGYVTRIEIVGGRAAHLHRRSIAPNGLSSYHFGSTYEPYDDCPSAVVEAAEQAAALLDFELGSFDIIETAEAPVFIDANSVSNVSEDCEDLLGYDLMAEHAAYIAGIWETLRGV